MITGTVEELGTSPHVAEWTCPEFFKIPERFASTNGVGCCVYSPEYQFWDYKIRIAAQPYGSPRLPNTLILAIYGADVEGITGWELELRRTNGTTLRKSSGWREPGKYPGREETVMRIYVPTEEAQRACVENDAVKCRCTLYCVDPEFRTAFRNQRSVTNSAQTEVIQRCDALTCDMEELMLREDYCDLLIRVEDKEYKAHKSIFTVRSPVFTNMFKHKMTENITGVIDIDDCDKVTFREFMRYLYAARVGKFATHILCKVYKIADKYQVNELKTYCVDYIMEYMATESVPDAVLLALQYGEEYLLEWLTNFFEENMTEVKETENWQTFEADYPDEADKLLLEALKLREIKNARPKQSVFMKLFGRVKEK